MTCEPPCWNGIIPGETGKDELIQILSSLPIVAEDSIDDIGQHSRYRYLVSFDLSSGASVDVRFLEDTVTFITFSGNLHYTFGDAVNEFSEPEIYIITQVFCRGWLPGDRVCTHVAVLDPCKGVCMTYERPLSDSVSITAGTLVHTVMFFNSDEYNELLDAGVFGEAQNISEWTRTWTGFGELSED